MSMWIDILGWLGALEVITAYALNSSQKIKSNSITFQLLNLTGAVLLIINSIYHKTYPFTLINTVWAVIALVTIVGILKKKQADG